MTTCKPNCYDCNMDSSDGCEVVDTKDPCVCVPGSVESCYTGEPGTLGVGPCIAGSRTCAPTGMAWGACQGQILPQWETCANQVDDDCNGLVDEDLDLDNDGWTMCNGDCHDNIYGLPDWFPPEYVNPGAMEFWGNGVDDDCDPSTSDDAPPPDCLTAEKLSNVVPDDLVRAMDLCQFTDENAPLPVRKWGVTDARFVLADGSVPSASDMDHILNEQAAVLAQYGSEVVPGSGPTMAGLSTGMMRDTVHHGYAGSTSFSSVVNPPADYVAQNGGTLPYPANCSPAMMAYDSVNLRVRVRVPTNLTALQFSFAFSTGEDPQNSCVPRDDFAVGWIDPLPSNWQVPLAARNLLLLDAGTPASVNSGFFEVCNPWAPDTCPLGSLQLIGTPMQRMTSFQQAKVAVDPGQVFTLDFVVFDGDDAAVDSVLLLDGMQFSDFLPWLPCARSGDAQSAMGGPLHCH